MLLLVLAFAVLWGVLVLVVLALCLTVRRDDIQRHTDSPETIIGPRALATRDR
jgi:hypothetical protein